MRKLQILGLTLSAISLIVGVLDIVTQYLNNDEVYWRIPIILIGIGVGFPLVIWPFYEPTQALNEEELDGNDLSGMYQDDIGIFRSMSGDTTGGADDDYSGGFDDYGGFGEGGGGDGD